MPSPLWLLHFTHLRNLEAIVRDGLLCDAQAHDPGRLVTEIGNVGIKERRRSRRVEVGPGGVVADYVPFYFGTRSPMLGSIHKGRVPGYTKGQSGIVYLCTTLERVEELGLPWVGTDRNAVLRPATMTTDRAELAAMVDWPLMRQRMWNNTPEFPDRQDRRMAELLVHRRVPWEAVLHVMARSGEDLSAAREVVTSLGSGHMSGFDVRAHWYF